MISADLMTVQAAPTGLRMAMVASSLARAGAEKQFVYLTTALNACGVNVRVFHLSDGGFYEGVLRQTPIKVCNIAAPGRPFKILSRLLHALRSFRPHIVVASQFSDIIHAGFAGRLTGALTVGGIRSDGFWEWRAQGWRSRFIFHMPHALVANSHRAITNLATLGVNPARSHFLSNVIDLQEFDKRRGEAATIALPRERPIVIAAGRLNADKQFARFLEALALARKKVPSLFGVLAGSDDGAGASLEQRARSLGLLPNHLCFTGECANIPALLDQAKVLLLTSDQEGVPNIVIEAMAASLPVIATPAGDAARLVKHATTGYIVNFDGIPAMADGIVRLVNCSPLRLQMGQAGRERIESEYDYSTLGQRALRLFQNIAAQHKRTHLLGAFTSVCARHS